MRPQRRSAHCSSTPWSFGHEGRGGDPGTGRARGRAGIVHAATLQAAADQTAGARLSSINQAWNSATTALWAGSRRAGSRGSTNQ